MAKHSQSAATDCTSAQAQLGGDGWVCRSSFSTANSSGSRRFGAGSKRAEGLGHRGRRGEGVACNREELEQRGGACFSASGPLIFFAKN